MYINPFRGLPFETCNWNVDCLKSRHLMASAWLSHLFSTLPSKEICKTASPFLAHHRNLERLIFRFVSSECLVPTLHCDSLIACSLLLGLGIPLLLNPILILCSSDNLCPLLPGLPLLATDILFLVSSLWLFPFIGDALPFEAKPIFIFASLVWQ